jgi:hypothetical protein
MKHFVLVLFFLCLIACVDEYADSIELRRDGSAVFFASIYPCEPDSSFIDNIRDNYDSIKGLKFDSAWFSQKDSLYSLNFKLSFENLFSWQGDKKFEKDLVGNVSLKKIDSLENGYSFERVINPNAENENGAVVPEESISPFAVEQITGNDSAFWEYTLVLPQGAILLGSEPVDAAHISPNTAPNTLRWKFPAGDAISKRILLKADFSLPPETQPIHFKPFLGVAVGCIIMLLAIALLVRKLKKLSTALKELKNAEKNFKGE